MRELKRQSFKVLRTFEPSRFAEDMLTTSYQKLVSVLRRKPSRATDPDCADLELSPESRYLRAKSGGAR